nr:DNA adenine methylase [Arthrobacter pigmenti]
MQYLGSKQRIASWVVDEIAKAFPGTENMVDLMSGSGAIAHEASMRGWNIHANDIQPYSHQVLRSAFETPREELQEIVEWLEEGALDGMILCGDRSRAEAALLEEDQFTANAYEGTFDWRDYSQFCERFSGRYSGATGNYDLFLAYYPNTYFGVRQCLEIDAIREKAAQSSLDNATHLIAALISGLTFVASTTTHLAQFLKPTSHSTALNLIKRRSQSVQGHVLECLKNLINYPMPDITSTSNAPFQAVLAERIFDPTKTVVYADPPYFKEHYSRYYHVLDTLALYDYPDLTFNNRLGSVTVGRYRSDRIVSDFGLRSKVADTFQQMFCLAWKNDLQMALSYASTSLLSADRIIDLAESAGYETELRQIELRHSGQGQVRTKSDVTEYLFLLRHAH